MKSKIIAARMATLSGIGVIIASVKNSRFSKSLEKEKKGAHSSGPKKSIFRERNGGLLLP